MYSSIKLEKSTIDVPDSVLLLAAREIQEGQKRALKDFCLDKYKKLYENIDPKDKEKIQKKFPVLFLKEYWKAE